jgi:hypothetical protein
MTSQAATPGISGSIWRPRRKALVGMLLAPPDRREVTQRGCGAVLSLISFYLVAVIVLPLMIGALVACRTLPDGKRCTQCGTETFRLKARWLRWSRLLLREHDMHRRWCPACGWEGLMRVARDTRRSPIPLATAQPVRAVAPAVQPAQTMELCSLEVDGRPWRVLLQSWSDPGCWYGRILFVGSTGKLCADAGQPFSGRSYHDVLSQALGLSEQMLARRLRGVLSQQG